MKKGITLLSMILSLLFLIGVSFISAGLIIKINIAEQTRVAGQQQYTLTVSGAHLPVIYQSALAAAIDATTVNGYNLTYLLTKANPNDCTKDIEINNVQIRWNDIGNALKSNIQLDKNIVLAVETDKSTEKIYSSSTQTLRGVKYNIYKIVYNMLPATNCRLVMYVLEPGG